MTAYVSITNYLDNEQPIRRSKSRNEYNYKNYVFEEEYDNTCSICINDNIYGQCDKCGDSVCNSDGKCCLIFPHYGSSEYLICKNCTINIEKCLKPYIEELAILKNRIKRGATYKQQSPRSDRSSVSSISSDSMKSNDTL